MKLGNKKMIIKFLKKKKQLNLLISKDIYLVNMLKKGNMKNKRFKSNKI